MAMDLAAMVSPGNFRAQKKDLEKMLADFNLYVECFSNFLTVTDNTAGDEEKKKALLKAVGGQNMVYLLKYIEKVADNST